MDIIASVSRISNGSQWKRRKVKHGVTGGALKLCQSESTIKLKCDK